MRALKENKEKTSGKSGGETALIKAATDAENSGVGGGAMHGDITLEAVYDSLQDMIFTKDINGRITSVNNLYAEHTMLSKESIIGKDTLELGIMAEERAKAIMEADRKVIEEKKEIIESYWSTFANGKRLYVCTVRTPLIEKGEVTGVLVILKDQTSMMLAMEEADKQNKRLKTLGKVSELMLEPDITAFEQSMHEAIKIIGDGINADKIDIWRLHRDGGETSYIPAYNWAAGEELNGAGGDRPDRERIERGDKIKPFIDVIVLKGKSVNCKVCDMGPAAKEFLEILKIKSALILPIILGNEPWGFIGAFDTSKERSFTENEKLLLSSSRQMIVSAMTRIEMTKDIVQKTEQLEYSLNTKRDFFARMSHEIRTPMNAILGLTELALRERMSNAATEHIVTVKQVGSNLLTILNDILNVSKIESGNMEVVNMHYSLSSLLYDIISIIRMRIAYTRIRFLVDIDSNLPAGLIGDEAKVRQILINLLGNAVKYTEKGYVKLAVRGDLKGDEMVELVFTVSDSGRGIKEEDQKRLFDDYSQVDKENNVGIEGAGLGLSITSGLLSVMDGKIKLKSEYGKGSEFTVTIPQKIDDWSKLAVVHNPDKKKTLIYERRAMQIQNLMQEVENLGIACDFIDNADDLIKKAATGSYAYILGSTELMNEVREELEAIKRNFKIVQIIGITDFGEEADNVWRTLSTPIHTIALANVYNGEVERYSYITEDEASIRFSAPDARVLIVDDIMTNLKVAAGLLSPYEVEVDICSGGAEAIEAVQEKVYDMVFMDHKMPGIDGVEATKRIRAMGGENEYYKNLPIVALTANVMINMKEIFLNAGFSDFISKPIDTVLLGNVMRQWIPKSKQRRYYAVEVNERQTLNLDSGISIAIEGVDVDKGIRTSGDRIDLYLEILATFMEEANERITQLRDYVSNGNIRLYTISVHALKGALANIGAAELSESALKLERAGESKNIDYIEKNNDRFINGIRRLLTSLKAALEESAKGISRGKTATKEDTEEFLKTLKSLRVALADMDAGTMNRALEELLSTALTEQSLSTVRLISKHVLMAEFDDAEQMVDSLIEALGNEETE
ncbi:MAG: ATP-binding protein [Oscillospiraceae bacterium]|nr:ATP-binding protein [Oscillospiraceae bacterium]